MDIKTVPLELLEFLKAYSVYLIIGHKEPDGDCIGSQMALASYLRRKGKKAVLLSSGPFTRTEILPYEHAFLDHVPDGINLKEAAIIVLDCSSLPRVGRIADNLPVLPLALIDHHAAGEAAGSVQYIDTKAPAVTRLIQAILEATGDTPTKEEAELLFFGLCTDTGFFRHLDENGADSFTASSKLVSLGASPKKTYSMIYGGKSLFTRKLMGEILSRTEPSFDCRLLLSYVTEEDHRRFGIASRDSDMLYQLLMTVAGVEAAVLIRQESENNCTVGFRSRDSVDVGSIAAQFGGGGHRLAAGLSIPGRIEDVRERMLEAFDRCFVTRCNDADYS
jgi:bifunctional oligoribonuclease and PAP phosphatase NrnA